MGENVAMAVRKKSLFFSVMRVFCLFLGGLAVAFVIALSQVNLETLRGDVLNILRGATGLPVEIDGTVSWKFSLRPRVELNSVRVPNATWAHAHDAFTASKVDVTLNLISLFRHSPTIQNVKIYDAKINLERNGDGRYSVMPSVLDTTETADGDKKTDAATKYPFEDPGLGGVEIKNLNANILGRQYSLAGFNIRYMPHADKREYVGWIKTLDAVYPFIVSYSEYNADRKIYPVRMAVSAGGDALIANIALEGTSRAPIDFILTGDVPDIAAVARAFNVDMFQIPRMNVNIAGGFDRNKITLRKSVVNISDNVFTFSGDYDWSGHTPAVRAAISAKNIDLQTLFPDMYSRKWIRPNRELNVFRDIPLFGRELRTMNLSLDADIGRLTVYRELSIDDLNAKIRLNGGNVRIDAKSTFARGDVRASLDGDIDNDGRIYAAAAGAGRHVFVGEILNQIRTNDFISDLPVDFEFYVRANGRDLSEIMQTITGPAYAYAVGPGYAHSALVANMYGTDFLTSVRHSIQDLFRSEKKYNQIKISCAAVNAKLRDGRIETQNGVAVETNAINLRLAGSLDLGGESMKLALTTVPVRGLKLSLTGNIVNSIELTGNLAQPDIKISGAAVAGKVASATGIGLLLAPFTGGLGLVAGAGVGLLAGDLLENWLADDQPCRTAMSRGAPDMRDDPEWMSVPMPELVGGMLGDEYPAPAQ